MSRIRCTNTRPELAVRSILHRLGFRFKGLSSRVLPGRPDVVLPMHKTVVFVHGCFWHRHANCKMAYHPKSNRAFWNAKFLANIRRDREVRRQLRGLGWRVLVVWECQLSRPMAVARRLVRLIAINNHAH